MRFNPARGPWVPRFLQHSVLPIKGKKGDSKLGDMQFVSVSREPIIGANRLLVLFLYGVSSVVKKKKIGAFLVQFPVEKNV